MKSTISIALALASVLAVKAQDTPLASKRFQYNDLPYQADTSNGDRGRQFGYNRCNSTTENQESRCQTSLFNSLDDFCLWGPPEPNSLIGNTEGEAVAWCTRPGRGTRLIPKGAIKGIQFMKTPDYVQVIGKIDQTLINIAADDDGGEMDPHGADQRGNPLGGLVFSNAYPSNGGNNNSFQQVIEWHNFMGGGEFCLKACDPAGANARRFCEHIYDRIGCRYNAPAAYDDIEGKFISCQGANQDFPGVYTLNGQVLTYTQPPEAAGPIQTLPYDPKIPASSNCVTFSSDALYGSLPTASVSGTSSPTGSSPGTTTARPTGSSSSGSQRPSSSSGATPGPTTNAAARGMKADFSTSGAAGFGFVMIVSTLGMVLGAGAVFAL